MGIAVVVVVFVVVAVVVVVIAVEAIVVFARRRRRNHLFLLVGVFPPSFLARFLLLAGQPVFISPSQINGVNPFLV